MTRLYRLDRSATAIARHFGAHAGADPWTRGYVAPGRFAPIITAGREFVAGPAPGRGTRRIVPRLWGVPPPPSASDPSRTILTVRNTDSPFWIGNLRNTEFRCLVPATTFVEWSDAIDVEGRRLRRHYTLAEQDLFAFAGVWKDAEVPGFAILTCPANATLRREGRDTMPVILPPGRDAQECWLHGGWAEAKTLVKACPDGVLRRDGPHDAD